MSKHSEHSSFREKMLEWLLLGGLMKHFWVKDRAELEVLHAAVDDQGYDVMLNLGSTTWLLQLKSTLSTSSGDLIIHKKLFSRAGLENGVKIGVLLSNVHEKSGDLNVKYSFLEIKTKSIGELSLKEHFSRAQKERQKKESLYKLHGMNYRNLNFRRRTAIRSNSLKSTS